MIVYGSPAQDVLQAAIDTIRTARSRESEARAAVEQHIKGCMALVKPECAAHLPRTEIERHVSVGHAVAGYVCVQCSPAAACSLSRVKAHPLACTHCLWVCWCLRMCRDLVRAFRRPDRRDLVQMIFRTAEAVAPCTARGDSGRGAATPLAGDHMDCQRRADVGARLFRLCSPVVTTLLDDFGFSMSSPMHCACAPPC